MSFTSLSQLARQAEERGLSIARLMMSVEERQSGLDEDELMAKMASQFAVMEQAVRKGILEPERSRTGLTGQDAARVHAYLGRGASFVPPEPLRAMAYALAVSEVNAAMGRIVATPTAGAAGILPGVLVSLLDSGRYTRDQLVCSLFTAAALGLAIANAACISGAAGGCQAEVGSATAMAAGALVELAGGSPQAAVHAAALALQNSLGLVCDPVAGLVEVPCVTRNGLHAITALAAADMALAGATRATALVASSIGGGKVEVIELDGLHVRFTGERFTLILYHVDEQGFLARVSRLLDERGSNIARLSLERWTKGGDAVTVCEVDQPVPSSVLADLRTGIRGVRDIRVVSVF
ncbi:L-serine ammonia-lyase, iron-sulfur-dependent, subunit alpha [Alicyclobacillus kakegawensis]|uniref:L-serine ammonia-lyase, iron-sulfur-dependent, subunit alpha n=1 Tax=Alicyclobacillus kakegawensis TaxID=392012 RepID=UPI000836C404|nr:L-serine ammonia-lyase, iron-sulfur-dependent, subunit alpha [Alicyclobacillus kakegawensis]